jgi:hypothetical protein
MRFISSRTHGIIDYLMAIVVVSVPWWSGTHRGGAETWVPVVLGLGVALTALMTDFELGVMRRIPMRMHLALDLVVGALLALSPWLFRFSDLDVRPYVVLGVLEIGAALCTRTVPASATARATGQPMATSTAGRRQ